MSNIKEAFEEKTIYVVHSDTDENNILQEFDDLSEALEYAKDNIDELTYVEEVVMNPESEEIYSTEILWSYDEDGAEDLVVCEWCHELDYETNCRKELNLGVLCKNCQAALYSRGEKPVFYEAYDSDYAEGDDIFVQEFPEASTESKYSLEESSEPKWNIGSNKLVDRDSIEYQYLEELAARLQEERPYNEDGDYIFYEVARTYEDYGAGMEWYTIIVNDPKSFAGSYQLLYPNQWIKLANTGDVEGVLKDILKGSQLTELFDLSVNAALDGGDNNDVSVLSSYEPEKGEDKLDELFDADINLSLDGGTGNAVSVLSPLGGLSEELKEGLNNSEFAEYMQLCKEIGIKGFKDLEAFMNEVGLEAGCDPHKVLEALREYRAELGPDFKIVNEDVKLSENYAVDNFNIPGFELQVTDEFEDERVKGFNVIYSKDGVDIVEIEIWEVDSPISVTKNLYRPNLMNSTYDSFDGFVADLEYKVERYFTEQLAEGYKIDLPQIRVREIKGDLDLHGDITFDLPEPVDESDEDGWRGASEIRIVEKEDGSYECYYQWLDQDGDLIESDADEYFDDFEELLYWLDDYLVNIVDLEEYIGSEIVEGLKEARDPEEETELRTQDPNAEPEDQPAEPEQVIEVDSEVLEEAQAPEVGNNIKRPEAPKDLSVVKEPGDPSISEGDLVWFNTRRGEDVVIQIIKFTKDPEGNRDGCRVVYTEPRVTRPHKEHWWKEDNK